MLTKIFSLRSSEKNLELMKTPFRPTKSSISPPLRKLVNFDFEANDSKFCKLLSVLKNDFNSEKCVLFSFYRGTLAYLRRRLSDEGIKCAVIHGGIEQEDRNAILEVFATSSAIQVLLSSEVGSEGIDLQFCSVVINYDLPWNPLRIEQRIGRIDRIGQKAPRLRIVHFKVRGTVEERLYERLHMRLELFRNSLGDLDAILGEEVEKLRRDLFSRDLTPEMEIKRIEQTARVIRIAIMRSASLRCGAKGWWQWQIISSKRSRENRGLGRFVTPEELEESVRDFFARNFQGSQLRWDDPAPHCFRLKLSFEAQGDLNGFLGSDFSLPALRLRQRDIALCFRLDILRELDTRLRKQVLFVTHLSPLIRWITKRNGEAAGLFQPVFAAQLIDETRVSGFWLFLVRRWSFEGGLKAQRMAYAAFGPTGLRLIGDDAEKFVLQILREGRPWSYPSIDQNEIMNRYQAAARYLDEELAEAFAKFAAENANYVEIRLRRTDAFFARQIESAEKALATARGRGQDLRRFEGKVKSESEKRDERLRELRRGLEAGHEETDVALAIVHVGTAQ